jgi:hypothetical protein
MNLEIYLFIELEAKRLTEKERESAHPLEVGRIGCPIKSILDTMCTHKNDLKVELCWHVSALP